MKLVLYYANWCGHCKTLKQKGGDGVPEGGWETLEKEKSAGKLNFDLKAIEENNISSSKQIGGYPTIELQDDKGNKIADYMGNRSAEDMKKFVKKHQPQHGGKRGRRRKRKRKTKRKRRSGRKRSRKRRRKHRSRRRRRKKSYIN